MAHPDQIGNEQQGGEAVETTKFQDREQDHDPKRHNNDEGHPEEVRPEEERSPREIEEKLGKKRPESRPFGGPGRDAVPDEGKGRAHHRIEHRPDRTKDRIGRHAGRFSERGIPVLQGIHREKCPGSSEEIHHEDAKKNFEPQFHLFIIAGSTAIGRAQK